MSRLNVFALHVVPAWYHKFRAIIILVTLAQSLAPMLRYGASCVVIPVYCFFECREEILEAIK